MGEPRPAREGDGRDQNDNYWRGLSRDDGQRRNVVPGQGIDSHSATKGVGTQYCGTAHGTDVCHVGPSKGAGAQFNTKTVGVPPGTLVPAQCGPGCRKNGDYAGAGDNFRLNVNGGQLSATRIDAEQGSLDTNLLSYLIGNWVGPLLTSALTY